MRITTSKSICSISSSNLKRKCQAITPIDLAQHESDSNADMCGLGNDWTVLHYNTRAIDIHLYDQAYTSVKDVPIVSEETAYIHPLHVLSYAVWSRHCVSIVHSSVR